MTKVVFKVINMVLVFATVMIVGMACENTMPQAPEDRQTRLLKALDAFMYECRSLGGTPWGGWHGYTGKDDTERKATTACTFTWYNYHVAEGITDKEIADRSVKLCRNTTPILPRIISSVTGECYVVLEVIS